MADQSRPSLLQLIFTVRGSVILKIMPRVMVMTAFAILVVLAARRWPAIFAPLNPAPFTLFGIALSIFKSFRNNACYDRWWEGRKLWGALLLEVRSLARQCQGLPDEVRRRILRDVCGFALVLAAQLRGDDAIAAARGWTEAPLDDRVSIPDALLADAGSACLQAQRDGVLDGWRMQLIEARLTALSAVQAGCERIRNTPMPFAYHLLLHRTAALFCLMLPFGLAHAFGYAAPVFVMVISYAFFGLDALGDELEDPFGREANDLPIDLMAAGIEREVRAWLAAKGEDRPVSGLSYRG